MARMWKRCLGLAIGVITSLGINATNEEIALATPLAKRREVPQDDALYLTHIDSLLRANDIIIAAHESHVSHASHYSSSTAPSDSGYYNDSGSDTGVTTDKGATETPDSQSTDGTNSTTNTPKTPTVPPKTTYPANHAPITQDISESTQQGEAITITLAASDDDNDTLQYRIISQPSAGKLREISNGTYEYTPNSDFNGSDSFTYTASDQKDTSNVATVSIAVNKKESSNAPGCFAFVLLGSISAIIWSFINKKKKS